MSLIELSWTAKNNMFVFTCIYRCFHPHLKFCLHISIYIQRRMNWVWRSTAGHSRIHILTEVLRFEGSRSMLIKQHCKSANWNSVGNDNGRFLESSTSHLSGKIVNKQKPTRPCLSVKGWHCRMQLKLNRFPTSFAFWATNANGL